jgi:hypothetical protein
VVGWGESCRSAAGYGGRREYFLQSAWARSVAMAIGGGCDGGMCGRAVGRGELVSMVGGTAPLAPFDCAEASGLPLCGGLLVSDIWFGHQFLLEEDGFEASKHVRMVEGFRGGGLLSMGGAKGWDPEILKNGL